MNHFNNWKDISCDIELYKFAVQNVRLPRSGGLKQFLTGTSSSTWYQVPVIMSFDHQSSRAKILAEEYLVVS